MCTTHSYEINAHRYSPSTWPLVKTCDGLAEIHIEITVGETVKHIHAIILLILKSKHTDQDLSTVKSWSVCSFFRISRTYSLKSISKTDKKLAERYLRVQWLQVSPIIFLLSYTVKNILTTSLKYCNVMMFSIFLLHWDWIQYCILVRTNTWHHHYLDHPRHLFRDGQSFGRARIWFSEQVQH